MAASLLFSFVVSPDVIGTVKDEVKNFQTAFFALAFTSIGLETKFSELFGKENKKPLYVFLIAQGFNILVTLGVAWLLFG